MGILIGTSPFTIAIAVLYKCTKSQRNRRRPGDMVVYEPRFRARRRYELQINRRNLRVRRYKYENYKKNHKKKNRSNSLDLKIPFQLIDLKNLKYDIKRKNSYSYAPIKRTLKNLYFDESDVSPRFLEFDSFLSNR